MVQRLTRLTRDISDRNVGHPSRPTHGLLLGFLAHRAALKPE
jgi:hypothetical protein